MTSRRRVRIDGNRNHWCHRLAIFTDVSALMMCGVIELDHDTRTILSRTSIMANTSTAANASPLGRQSQSLIYPLITVAYCAENSMLKCDSRVSFSRASSTSNRILGLLSSFGISESCCQIKRTAFATRAVEVPSPSYDGHPTCFIPTLSVLDMYAGLMTSMRPF